MEVFRFKQFSVRNERSSMKVNTDGVLLGAAMTLRPSDRLLLDIGTGTGVIALMAAQRLAETHAGLKSEADGSAEGDFKIIGIDIDYDSAMEAAKNFLSSPWSNKLVAEHISLNDFEKEFDDPQRAAAFPRDAETDCTKKWYNPSDDENCGEGGYGENGTTAGKFDAIFSNPPYFESSLKSPDERKRTARHADTLSYREIIAFASSHLSPAGHLSSDPDCNESQQSVAHDAGRCPMGLPSWTARNAGRLSMILPYETEREAVRYAASFGLRLFRRLRIRTTPSRPFSRVILEFVLEKSTTTSGVSIEENANLPIIDGGANDEQNKPAITDDELTIQDSSGRSADNPAGYTPAYRSLVRDFLLI